jgi:hypothetical protein
LKTNRLKRREKIGKKNEISLSLCDAFYSIELTVETCHDDDRW